MRWEWLFSDLEAQMETEERAGFEADLADLVRAERGALALRDRLRAHVGCDLTWHVPHGGAIQGRLLDVGCDWALVRESRGDVLVPLAGVVGVSGLSRAAAGDDGPLARSLRLTVVLRGLARDRSPVLVHTVDGGTVGGTIDRVGADHLDVAVHPIDEPRRPGAVVAVRSIPVGAILRLAVR